ncbi:hypothetical protein [Yoonia sp.]|uniref:hypothetical protein n=1 Tax=Yoonia sp. TaxID=2212373 RepID=UPI002DFB2B88|nr:hypothetical protein [Yoonia sp.]
MKLLAATALLAVLSTTAALADQLTAIVDAQRGSMVTVQGTVERITDEDEFRLADATGSIRIYVGPNWVPAEVGEEVIVNGFVDDDLGPLEIYARTLTRADGTEITFNYSYE